jgi:UDP-glucose 4-epimerase
MARPLPPPRRLASPAPVLVVGAGGAVGRLLAPLWARAGAAVVLTSRAALPDAGLPALRWTPGEGLPGIEGAAAMIVLAGPTPRGGGDPVQGAAIAGACMAAARTLGIGRVLLASSAAVYGVDPARTWSEDDAPRPVSPYGAAKLAAEAAAGTGATALRIGNVAGADSLLAGRLPPPVEAVAIDTYPDGTTPVRSYIGPDTLAAVLIALARHAGPLPPALNIGAPKPVAMGDLAAAADLRWTARHRPDSPARRIVLDTRRLWRLVAAPAGASDPAAMVAEVRAAGGRP